MARPNNSAAIGGYVQGLREAKAAFQALEPTFRARLLEATETTLAEIVRAAKNRVLSSPSVQTRNLYNAIGYTLTKTNGRGRAGIMNVTTTINVGGRKVRVKGIITAGRGGSASAASGARADRPASRAHFIEFGTHRQAAEPFMVPAAQSQEQPYLSRCQAAGRDAERDLAAGRFA